MYVSDELKVCYSTYKQFAFELCAPCFFFFDTQKYCPAWPEYGFIAAYMLDMYFTI
jgi:hypothetical protein